MDYTVIGDAVNFVFRLQSLCKPWPNGIIISEKTYYACQSIPQIEEIGAYEGDISKEKLKIYRIIGL
jgi:class 3 adenylate cyclase